MPPKYVQYLVPEPKIAYVVYMSVCVPHIERGMHWMNGGAMRRAGEINGGLYCYCSLNFTTYLEQFSSSIRLSTVVTWKR